MGDQMNALLQARCYGFGEMTGNCPNKPGGKWSPYFCPACDEERMAHLRKQFDRLDASSRSGLVRPTAEAVRWAIR